LAVRVCRLGAERINKRKTGATAEAQRATMPFELRSFLTCIRVKNVLNASRNGRQPSPTSLSTSGVPTAANMKHSLN